MVASAQELPDAGTIVAASANAPLRLNRHLDELVWAMTDSITYFRQREPAEGERGTETTVMKLVRDREARYVG